MISVIIPFYNEEGNIAFVLDEIVEVLTPLGREFEIIAVNDGSNDDTGPILNSSLRDIPQLKIINHTRNFGQSAAYWSGFETAAGDILILTDGDRQNDFHDVPKMLERLEGHEAVFGQRKVRRDATTKKMGTRVAFMFRSLILQDSVKDTACGLKVLKRDVLRHLIPFKGFHRFIPFLIQQAGMPYAVVEVNHRPRISGVSKYSFLKFYYLPAIADLWAMRWYKQKNIHQLKKNAALKTSEVIS